MENVIFSKESPDCTDNLHVKVFVTKELNAYLLWMQVGQNLGDGMYDSESMIVGYSLQEGDIISYAEDLAKLNAVELLNKMSSIALRNLSEFD